MTSPLTERCMSVTSSGRSSTSTTIRWHSGLFRVIALAMSCMIVVLPAFGRRHDQGALPLADRHDQVDHPGGQLVAGGLQAQPLVRVQRGELGELGALLGLLDRLAVDAVEADQRVELLPLVGRVAAFLRAPARRRSRRRRGAGRSCAPCSSRRRRRSGRPGSRRCARTRSCRARRGCRRPAGRRRPRGVRCRGRVATAAACRLAAALAARLRSGIGGHAGPGGRRHRRRRRVVAAVVVVAAAGSAALVLTALVLCRPGSAGRRGCRAGRPLPLSALSALALSCRPALASVPRCLVGLAGLGLRAVLLVLRPWPARPPPAPPARGSAERRSRRCCAGWDSASACSGAAVARRCSAGAWPAASAGAVAVRWRRRLGVAAGAGVGLATALTDGGDQLALAHAGGALDTDLLGQSA